MNIARNLFAAIGVIFVVVGLVLFLKVSSIVSDFDPNYLSTYTAFAEKLIETKDPGLAMVWSVPVNEDLTEEDVKDALKNLAAERNFLFVGEAQFYKQVEAVTGKPFRHVAFLSFCDVLVGKMMLEYQDAYSAFMPCRISLVKDKKGKLWLYSMNLDMMIYGGKELPATLKKEAIRIRNTLWDMMQGASQGEF
ncbi:DUF302 domain-containing protein [Magnetococcales bacterium HHB-1]